MTGENLDLTGEQDPTERMQELQDADLDTENEREVSFVGTETTEAFDVDEALSNL